MSLVAEENPVKQSYKYVGTRPDNCVPMGL